MKQITNFWNWFQDNEEAIKNAFLLGINTEEVFINLNRNYKYISKRIGFLIIGPQSEQDKSTIIFTAAGYRKLFPKIIELEDTAPKLQYFIPQAFIKPMQNLEKFREGNDAPYTFENFKIQISKLQFTLKDYNISTKHLKIELFMDKYDEIKQFEELTMELKFIVMEIIGEIAYRKHIKQIEFSQKPNNPIGLLDLIELPDYIDYLYKINARNNAFRL
jgi:hypothetical protein